MIRGRVWKIGDTLLPVVELGIAQGDGEIRLIPAVIDTGSDCDLLMSRERLYELGLNLDAGETTGIRGVHGERRSRTCLTLAIWDSEPRRVVIVEAAVPTLVGKGLLENFSVYIEMREGGAIVLQRLADQGVPELP